MRRSPTLLSLAACAVFAACSPTPVITPGGDDTMPQELSAHPGIVAWANVWKSIEPAVDPAEFAEQSTSTIEPLADARAPTQEELSPDAQRRYVLSPDGQRFVNIRAHEGEPDSSVELFNRDGSRMLETIAFCGTPCSYDAALWLDASRFVVLGQGEDVTADGAPSCTDINDAWSCDRRLTADLYDLAAGTRTRYVSPPHRFSRHPFAG